MRPILALAAIVVLTLTAHQATAVERTATLKVENMTCATCPYIVKQALVDIDGVESVAVSFDDKLATVVYDDEKISLAQLAGAVTDAGFPATPVYQ